MDYCGNCGEPLQGRFCRMCGTPVGPGPSETALAAVPGYGGGYGGTQAGEATQMFSAPAPPGYADPMAGYGTDPMAGYGQDPAGYGAEPTAAFGPEPTQQLTTPPSEFDALFRNEDGSPGAHGQTQMLPPVVEADYRMQPPGAVGRPPGGLGRSDPDEDDPRSNRPVLLATVGAVVVAAGVIVGLLYLGNQSTSGTPAGSSTVAAGTTGNSSAAQSGGQIQVPTDGATLAPTTAAPTTAASSSSSAAASFQGDSLPLGPGSSGDWVKWVQERLKQLGYYDGSASGNFDQATALAVQQFQAASGVTGDPASTVGLHTVVALEAAGGTPDLHLGSKSADVSRLNSALTYATGTHLSGSRYSMQTQAAVFRYQQAVGITPTGQVDSATWAKLQDGTLATG